MTKIFISHSKYDTEFSLQLAQALTEVGVDPWIDVTNIRAGKKWNDEIQEGLKTCEAMIVVITPESMASPNVGDEWLYYHRRGLPIFTVLWKPAEIHFQLERIQYIKFHEQEFAEAFEKLGAELKRQGIEVGGSDGKMHEIRSDDVTPSPTPPRIQQGEKKVLRVEDILPPPFEWCEIPGGKVKLEDNREFGGVRGGIYTVSDFAIAQYPITNAQYQIFVDATDGYVKYQWWDYSIEAKQWRKINVLPRETAFGGNDKPRTNISYYDAIAFCRWLTVKIGAEHQIILPTQQQWQRAAIGDTGWKFPWGNKWNENCCNTSVHENSSGTTDVQLYPQGASPFGVIDMIGNVHEYCLMEPGTKITQTGEAYAPIARGESWSLNWLSLIVLSASLRSPLEPLSGGNSIGFRPVYLHE